MSFLFLESALLVVALSLDGLVTFITYGSRRIRVPALSAAVVGAVCTGVLVAASLLGGLLAPLVREGVSGAVQFAVLFVLGGLRLFDAVLKAWIRRSRKRRRRVSFRAWGLRFLLEVYADPELADLDAGGTLSAREAAVLAAALSFDGAAAGLGAGFSSAAQLAVLAALSFAAGLASVFGGLGLGRLMAERSPVDLSPAAGALLILLAFLKL